MRLEARGVIIEQPRDIGGGKRVEPRSFAQQGQPAARPLRVARIGRERGAERIGGAVGFAQPFARLAEGEPRRRPIRREFERLFENLRRRCPVAVPRGRPGVGITPLGDRIAADEGVAHDVKFPASSLLAGNSATQSKRSNLDAALKQSRLRSPSPKRYAALGSKEKRRRSTNESTRGERGGSGQSNTGVLTSMCHAREASIQNTTKLQAGVNDFPAHVARFVVSPRLDPRFRGDDTRRKADISRRRQSIRLAARNSFAANCRASKSTPKRNGNFACERENFACELKNFACERKTFRFGARKSLISLRREIDDFAVCCDFKDLRGVRLRAVFALLAAASGAAFGENFARDGEALQTFLHLVALVRER